MTEIINQIESLIRAGATGQARRLLTPFAKKKVPREHLLPLANLARRANLPQISIRLLNPVVRAQRKISAHPASAKEASEYAASLIRIGSIDEALRILEKVNADEAPDSNLFSAFGHFAKWEYRESIPKLQTYISSKKISDYQRLIGRVNLLAALVHEKSTDAEKFGELVLRDAKETQSNLLLANGLELMSQYHILKGRFFHAKKYLQEAEKLIDSEETLDAFFIQKWLAVMKIYESPESKSAKKDLNEIIQNAKLRGHFETMRDCERHRSLATQDKNLARYLYAGTPNERFREELLKGFSSEVKVEGNFLRPFHEIQNGKVIDLKKENYFRGQSGRLLSRTLLTLLSDYFRPLRLANLYAQLYPGEFYNPISSPNRIHQILKRLRIELKKQKLPIEIIERDGNYHIECKKNVSLLLPVGKIAENAIESRLNKLKIAFQYREFSIHEAINVLHLSQRSVSRTLLEHVKIGTVKKTGSTAKARYSFIHPE